MKKHLAIAAAATALMAVTAGPALAQNCTPNSNNACLARVGSDPNKYISRLQPGVGGQVVCAATSANTLQYDIYTWYGAYVYACTMTQTCTWGQTNDPQAHGQFC